MSSGPEHYKEAERRLRMGAEMHGRDESLDASITIAQAQVHATLALAAATALYDADFDNGDDVEAQAWKLIAGSEVS